jgi:hypothetical protein
VGSLTDIGREERLRPVSVLGLGPKTARLQQAGFSTLGEVLDDAVSDFERLRRLPALGQRTIALVRERVGAVLSATGASGEVDWQAFSRLCGLPQGDGSGDLQPFSETDRAASAERLHLGVRTERIMAAGLTTVGCLMDDYGQGFAELFRAPRLGQAAAALVERRLRTLDACRDQNGAVDWTAFEAVCTGRILTSAASAEEPAAPRFSPAALARPVEVLRLGTKAKYLRHAGLRTIGHLEQDDVSLRLARLDGIGAGTAHIIHTRLADLAASADETGEPRWDAAAASWGYPLTPGHSLPTGEAFLASTAHVIEQWIEAHDNEADRLILGERLVRSREGRLKLDELGKRLGITRERVRQRERKLLDGLCDALLADDQSRSPVQFSSDFTGWWSRARAAFAGSSTLTYPAFVSGLERAWGVPAARLTEILPLALAVLTEGGQVVPPRTPIPPRLLEPLDPALLRMTIRSFPVGRALNDLEDAGCTSFGALLLAAMENRLPQGRSGEIGARILTAVAGALDPAGDIDGPRLAAALDLPLLPEEEVRTPGEFLEAFDLCAEKAAGLGRTTGRAADIWRFRTCRPAAIRPTLEETAGSFGTWAPSVKREESLLLASLNAQLVDNEQVAAGVVWRAEFLARVAEAGSVREEAGGDFDDFIRRLSDLWRIDEIRLLREAAGLWAVLSLYPGDKRRSRQAPRRAPPPEAADAPPQASEAIVLRGFRRVH